MIIDGNVIREMLAKTAKECIKDSKCRDVSEMAYSGVP